MYKMIVSLIYIKYSLGNESQGIRCNMNDTTTDRKLELVKQIRSQNHQNRYDLYNREQILYGQTYARENIVLNNDSEEKSTIKSTCKIRFILAALLFGLVIGLDISGKSLAGYNADQIYTLLAENYEEHIEAWVNLQIQK